ncbi:MAG: hypothetical protein NPIRA06_08230 [Nitrospirales bacterium]|nr:MAG: hypothetical protein NPIRA06_08230 [Nitrospirales bacterium]
MKEPSLSHFKLILFLTAIFLWFGSFQHLRFANTEKFFYDRLGDYGAFSAIVYVFLTRGWDDPIVGRIFWGM